MVHPLPFRDADYGAPTNDIRTLLAGLQADFKKQYGHFMSDQNQDGHNWWAQQCANLKPRLAHIMDQIFQMRSLHKVTCLVADDVIDSSAQYVWWLCFNCSCSQWSKQGYCPCVAMLAHWYDWGFTDLDGMSASLPGNKPMGHPRRRDRNPRQVQQPDIDDASSIVVEATPADAQPGEQHMGNSLASPTVNMSI